MKLIGITGSVCAGKTTLAASLAEALGEGGKPLQVIHTDSYLHSNAWLNRKGLYEKKGWPETYNSLLMHSSLEQFKDGEEIGIATYSHNTDDLTDEISAFRQADIVLIEGLNLAKVQDLLDFVIYLDAPKDALLGWYSERAKANVERARAENDESSFFWKFRDANPADLQPLCEQVWNETNLPNLEQNVEPLKADADVVVVKDAAHNLSVSVAELATQIRAL